MKNKLRIQISVGIIFFTAMIILGYYTIMVSHEVLKPGNAYYLTVHFKNSSGLTKENKVLVNGVNCGTVDRINLKEGFVEVKLEMFKRFRLYSNYRIRIKSEAALGGKMVSIYPGEKIDEKGNVYDMLGREHIFTGGVDDPIESITALIEENREDIRMTIHNLRLFSEKMNSGKGTIGKLFNDDKLARQANDLMEQIKETVEDAREQAPVTSFIRAALTAF